MTKFTLLRLPHVDVEGVYTVKLAQVPHTGPEENPYQRALSNPHVLWGMAQVCVRGALTPYEMVDALERRYEVHVGTDTREPYAEPFIFWRQIDGTCWAFGVDGALGFLSKFADTHWEFGLHYQKTT